MKRMLIVANGLEGGGAEKVLITLINHLDSRQYDITLYSMVACDIHRLELMRPIHYRYFFEAVIPEDNELVRFWKKLRNKLKLLIFDFLPARWFYFLFVTGKFDIEFAAIEGYATKVISGSGNPTSLKIAWVHIDLFNLHWTDIVFKKPDEEKKAYCRFDKIVCVSAVVKENLDRLFEVHEKSLVLYNPVDVGDIRQKARELVPVPRSTSKLFRMVTAGRLAEQKGFDRLLDIHRRLLADGLAHELWILGEGPQRLVLEAYIREHHLEESVCLLGFQANPYAFINQCDLFVCSSRAEGFSTVATEAVILGLPVVTTDCAGMRELLLTGEDSCGLITGNDNENLYIGLKDILQDMTLLERLKEKARARGSAFSLEKTMNSFLGLFENQ
ncbi:MAG: glycosyltransferase [Holophagaceae bacterium]|nr:glycosyltransferase [Holophagaceae bacterium]